MSTQRERPHVRDTLVRIREVATADLDQFGLRVDTPDGVAVFNEISGDRFAGTAANVKDGGS
jgi:hypothetical protein